MKTVFIRALGAEDKGAAVLIGISPQLSMAAGQRFEKDLCSFASIPGRPFAYWVSRRVLDCFSRLAPFQTANRTVRQGLATADDFRFLRCSWEVVLEEHRDSWRPLSKGGSSDGYYTDFWLRLEWSDGGRELMSFADPTTGKQRSAIRNPRYYEVPGFTYTLRAARFAPQILPERTIISTRGSGIFVETPTSQGASAAQGRFGYLALLNSAAFDSLVKLMLGRGGHPQFDMGDISSTPVPDLTPEDEEILASLARRAWSLKRSLDTITDNSHAFHLPALLQTDGGTLVSRATAWATHVAAVESELADIQAEIDDRCFALYGISGEDRRQIEEGFGPASVEEDDDSEDEDSDETEEVEADLPTLSASLVSWALGAAYGRFDVRLARGEREVPPEPEPFDPLPLSSPGMLKGEDGLPLQVPPPGYPLAFPADGILTDDPGHPSDLLARIEEVFSSVFGEDADAFLEEASASLDPRGHDLRTYLRKNFFEFHLKRYSKSRRKAPLFWQVATPSGSYALWLYHPRLTKDTFFRILNDLVGPKVQHEEAKLTRLTQEAGPEPSRSERKARDEQETFLEELRSFREEVARVAPLWDPDQDDGVLVNASLLWRLFPHHKNWQKECRACFQKLEAGDYDWAHLAMHLWPERVVRKCTEDRSLAIAHGLEEEFWREEDGTWHSRRPTEGELDALTRERTSASVQSALEGLLGAPGVGRGKGGRR